MERHELLQDLAAKIITVKRPHPVRAAIDGVDAAGKTTLAARGTSGVFTHTPRTRSSSM
jgi:hypothetical protein